MMTKEVVSEELHRKVCAERDAYRDLVCRMAICVAVQRYGTIGHSKNVMVGDYVFRVFSTKDGLQAEVVPQ